MKVFYLIIAFAIVGCSTTRNNPIELNNIESICYNETRKMDELKNLEKNDVTNLDLNIKHLTKEVSSISQEIRQLGPRSEFSDQCKKQITQSVEIALADIKQVIDHKYSETNTLLRTISGTLSYINTELKVISSTMRANGEGLHNTIKKRGICSQYNLYQLPCDISVASIGVILILFVTPIFVYGGIRRPVWENIQKDIPPHITNFVRHSPSTIILDRGLFGEIRVYLRVIQHMLFCSGIGRHEPTSWRNLPSQQAQIIDISTASLLVKVLSDRKFGTIIFAILFYMAPVLVVYLMLWFVALSEIYQNSFLGIVALMWAIVSAVYVQYVIKKIAGLRNFRPGLLTTTLPTTAHKRLLQFSRKISNDFLTAFFRLTSIFFSVFLIAFLAYLELQ